MKKVCKKIFACIIFLCLLSISVYQVIDLLEEKHAREKYQSFFDDETNFDVVFMGTSHAYNSVLPQELWREYGITSYNWGYSNCTLAENYYILQDVVKYTEPKLVVVDLYGLIEYDGVGNGKYPPDSIEQQHVQYDAIPLSQSKIEGVKDVFDDYEDNEDFLFNFAMFHNRWKELGEKDFVPEYSKQKGAEFLLGHLTSEWQPKDAFEQIEVDTACFTYLPKITEFCKEQGIELLFVYLPYPAMDVQQDVAYSMEAYFNDLGYCKYVNMIDMNIMNPRIDLYKDASHLNYIGASKVTSWLGNYIKGSYKIESHKNETGYESWDADYQEYVAYKASLFKPYELYDNLQLIYGNDFSADIEITESAWEQAKEDELLQCFLDALSGNVNVVVSEKELVYEERTWDALIRVKNQSDNTEIFYTGYSF